MAIVIMGRNWHIYAEKSEPIFYQVTRQLTHLKNRTQIYSSCHSIKLLRTSGIV